MVKQENDRAAGCLTIQEQERSWDGKGEKEQESKRKWEKVRKCVRKHEIESGKESIPNMQINR